MGTKIARLLLAVSIALIGALAGNRAALADISDADATNAQEGDNEASIDSGGSAASGDAVGGQVAGIVSSGNTSVDAKNRSEDVDIETGAATASNTIAAVVGENLSVDADVSASDITDSDADNLQEGDNSLDVSQTASASSGDGVGGQVIGAVTSAGGSADIVADNVSEDADISTGDADASSSAANFVGLLNVGSSAAIEASDISGVIASGNVQEGDNDVTVGQTAEATSGDGVAGQVIGAVSAGDTSIDARNRSTDVAAGSGDAVAENSQAGLTGLFRSQQGFGNAIDVSASDIDFEDATVDNLQEGDNSFDAKQSAAAGSGDGVAGQVIGAVTSAGGSADIVAENTSEDVDADTGDASADNASASFVGFILGEAAAIRAVEGQDITADDLVAEYVQEGDNDLTVDQTADATTGDGVGGQVIGAVSAGATSIDASNTSTDVDVATGNTTAHNGSAALIGLIDLNSFQGVVVEAEDIDVNSITVDNLQEGDNSLALAQASSANSGDAVGGEVIGAVTSAGGSADIVAENSSEDVDVETGTADAESVSASFVGHVDAVAARVEASDITGVTIDAENVQEGDNEAALDQQANASSGDGVGGQVIGAVSAGATSIDASNTSEDVDIDTGDADADSEAASFVGLAALDCPITTDRQCTLNVDAGDISGGSFVAANVQEGDNSLDLSQSATAATGDGVGGQVIGAVTAAGGSADIVAENSSVDADIATGDADADNEAATFVGLAATNNDLTVAADIDGVDDAENVQEGDNEISGTQTANAASGDGVAGQVLGAVAAGDVSIDARNSSEDVDVDTGDAFAANLEAAFAGLASSSTTSVTAVLATDISESSATNIQDGDNEHSFAQAATASSGDAVAGQVGGFVTSAGGSAEAVLDNTSEDVDAETGGSVHDNLESVYVGLAFTTATLFVSPGA